MFYWPKSVSKLFLMTASLMALYLYISFPHYQTGVQLPYCLQTVGQLPILCLLHYSELDMAGLTIEGKSFLEVPQKCLLEKKKKKKSLLMNQKGSTYRVQYCSWIIMHFLLHDIHQRCLEKKSHHETFYFDIP